MNLPNLALMRAYGTAPVFFEKTSGALPLAARMGAGLLGMGMLHSQSREIAGKVEESERQNQLARELEMLKMEAAIGGLRHTQAPVFAPSYMPPGMDEGMVRLAGLAKEAGVDITGLEKEAAFGGIFGNIAGAMKPQAPAPTALRQGAGQLLNRAGLGNGAWKWKLPALAGAYAGYKGLTGGVKGALGYMSAEPEGKTFGPRPGIAYGVNQYGQPQQGTPFMT
jgi:hypothetical protein